jgi:hypothetical protein
MEVVVVLLLFIGGCDGCSAVGCGCGNSGDSSTNSNSSISSTNNSSSTTELSFLLYINLLLCNLELGIISYYICPELLDSSNTVLLFRIAIWCTVVTVLK